MKVTYCDACRKEIVGTIFEFDPLIHIQEMIEEKSSSYIAINGGEMLPISGREIHYDLCHSCYNKIFGKAFEELVNIKGNVK